MPNIFYIIIIINLGLIIALLIFSTIQLPEEKEEIKEDQREKDYLKLLNMTTKEILIFHKKEDFIKDVGCYDVLKSFYSDDEIIKKIYPNYERL